MTFCGIFYLFLQKIEFKISSKLNFFIRYGIICFILILNCLFLYQPLFESIRTTDPFYDMGFYSMIFISFYTIILILLGVVSSRVILGGIFSTILLLSESHDVLASAP